MDLRTLWSDMHIIDLIVLNKTWDPGQLTYMTSQRLWKTCLLYLVGPSWWKKTCLSNCTPSWKSGGRLHHKLPEGILKYPLIIIKTLPAKILRKIYLYTCLFFFFLMTSWAPPLADHHSTWMGRILFNF